MSHPAALTVPVPTAQGARRVGTRVCGNQAPVATVLVSRPGRPRVEKAQSWRGSRCEDDEFSDTPISQDFGFLRFKSTVPGQQALGCSALRVPARVAGLTPNSWALQAPTCNGLTHRTHIPCFKSWELSARPQGPPSPPPVMSAPSAETDPSLTRHNLSREQHRCPG